MNQTKSLFVIPAIFKPESRVARNGVTLDSGWKHAGMTGFAVALQCSALQKSEIV